MNKQKKIPLGMFEGTSEIGVNDKIIHEIMESMSPDDFKTLRKEYLKKTSRNKIQRFNKWAYMSNIMYANKNEFKERMKLYVYETVDTFTKFIYQMYLQEIYTFDVDQSMFNMEPVSDIKLVMDQILSMTKEITKIVSSKTIKCRIKSADFSFMMYFGDVGGEGISFISALFDNSKKIVRFSIEGESALEKQLYSRPICTYELCPFVLGRKDREVDSDLKDIYSNGNTNDYRISLIYNTLLILLNSLGSNKEMTDPEYTTTEIYFIRKIFQERLYGLYPFDLCNWICEDENPDQFSHMCEADVLNKYITEPNTENPLIDFNRREMSYIIKYCEDAGYMVKDGGINFDLSQYIKESPYGDTFRFKIPNSEEEITTSCLIDKERDLLRIFVTYQLDDNIIFAYIDIKNVTNFNINNSYVSFNSSILFKDVSNIVSSKSDILEVIPDMFKYPGLLADVAQMVIETFIIIHDKPERSRMIRCAEQINNRTSSHNQRNNSNILVTRILKTKKDAKEYVEKMNSSGYIDREYILESWKRKGYYRRNNSGEKVWIPPTTCRRHLPLTEKEVHIRL